MAIASSASEGKLGKLGREGCQSRCGLAFSLVGLCSKASSLQGAWEIGVTALHKIIDVYKARKRVEIMGSKG